MTYQAAVIYLKEERVEDFFLSKMNAGIKHWAKAMAGMCQINYMTKAEKVISDLETLLKLVNYDKNPHALWLLTLLTLFLLIVHES